MHAVIIHRHFWPEQLTYALMLREIAQQLADAGHQVTVITTKAMNFQDEEALARNSAVKVIRITMLPESRSAWVARVINTVWYLLGVAVLFLKTRRADVVMVATTPPVLAAAATIFLARIKRVKTIYHFQDVHPESASAIGVVRNKWVLRLLRSMDARSAARADICVVLSEDMGRSLARRPGASKQSYRVINNFDPTEAIEALPEQEAVLPGQGLRILFAGNLGLFQGLEDVVHAVRALGEQRDISMIFLGDGALRSKLMDAASECLGRSIFFLERCSPERAKHYMSNADMGLVSLQKGVIQYAYPSKVMPYLFSGLPILSVVEPDSSLAKLLEKYQAGVNIAPGDVEALTALLRGLFMRKEEIATWEGNCLRLAKEEFGQSEKLHQWVRTFESLVDEGK